VSGQAPDQEPRNGPFEVTSSRHVYDNPWIDVREDRVRHDNGSTGLFGIVTLKPGVTTLAIDNEQHVYLLREFKYAYRDHSWELCSGGIDDGEAPLDAAKRELLEELGLAAETWTDLGQVFPFTVVVDSPNYLMLARGVTRHREPDPDAFEQIQVKRVPLIEALDMVDDGRMIHAGSVAALLKAARLLGV